MGRISKQDTDRVIEHLKTKVKGYKPNLTIFTIIGIFIKVLLGILTFWLIYYSIYWITDFNTPQDDDQTIKIVASITFFIAVLVISISVVNKVIYVLISKKLMKRQ